MAENKAETVRTCQNESKTQDSPYTTKVATPKPTSRWKQVSAGDTDMYVPWNAPVEALGTASRRITFGQAESGDEAIVPSVKSERAGEWNGGDGRQNGDIGDVDGTTSGGDIDSKRVEAALLAVGSQHMCQSRRTQNNDLPMSSWPPIQHAERPYGLVRRQRRRGRLKIKRINISQTPEVETTYLGRAHTTQPPGNIPNQAYGIVRPRRRCGVTHQTCLVLWTWRKLADELMRRMHPRSVERLSRLEGYRQPSLSISHKVKTILM